jgi:hypothetical protein
MNFYYMKRLEDNRYIKVCADSNHPSAYLFQGLKSGYEVWSRTWDYVYKEGYKKISTREFNQYIKKLKMLEELVR